ncbi:MAG: hypothetical protein ACREA0_15535, partial [bacterium]
RLLPNPTRRTSRPALPPGVSGTRLAVVRLLRSDEALDLVQIILLALLRSASAKNIASFAELVSADQAALFASTGTGPLTSCSRGSVQQGRPRASGVVCG